MTPRKIKNNKIWRKHNGAHLIEMHGSADKEWLFREDDVCGSGWKDVSRKWKLGESGKQNSFKLPKSGVITEQMVAIFSDSQMRPVVEGGVKIRDNWYANSTPGGRYIDQAVELKTACRTAFAQTKPSFVVGTNDLSCHVIMEKAGKQFRSMLLSASVSFPNAKVVVTALPTALGEFDNRVGIYNAMMAKVISEKNGIFLPMGTAFEKHDRHLWSFRHTVHLSSNWGNPKLLGLIEEKLKTISSNCRATCSDVIFSSVTNVGEPSKDDNEEQGGFVTKKRTKKKSRGGKNMFTNGRFYKIDNVLLKPKFFKYVESQRHGISNSNEHAAATAATRGLKNGGNALSQNEVGCHAPETTATHGWKNGKNALSQNKVGCHAPETAATRGLKNGGNALSQNEVGCHAPETTASRGFKNGGNALSKNVVGCHEPETTATCGLKNGGNALSQNEVACHAPETTVSRGLKNGGNALSKNVVGCHEQETTATRGLKNGGNALSKNEVGCHEPRTTATRGLKNWGNALSQNEVSCHAPETRASCGLKNGGNTLSKNEVGCHEPEITATRGLKNGGNALSQNEVGCHAPATPASRGLKNGGNALSQNLVSCHAPATTTISMPVLESGLIVNNFARTRENLVDTSWTLFGGDSNAGMQQEVRSVDLTHEQNSTTRKERLSLPLPEVQTFGIAQILPITEGRRGCHLAFGSYSPNKNELLYGDSLRWPVPEDVKNFFAQLAAKLNENKSIPSITVIELHYDDQIANKVLNGVFTHKCTANCWAFYPLQQDSHIGGISVIIPLCIAALDEPSFKSLRGGHSIFSYLKSISEYNDFLRLTISN
eukprot:gene10304-11367_t